MPQWMEIKNKLHGNPWQAKIEEKLERKQRE